MSHKKVTLTHHLYIIEMHPYYIYLFFVTLLTFSSTLLSNVLHYFHFFSIIYSSEVYFIVL